MRIAKNYCVFFIEIIKTEGRMDFHRGLHPMQNRSLHQAIDKGTVMNLPNRQHESTDANQHMQI